jgi:hypothetical protein
MYRPTLCFVVVMVCFSSVRSWAQDFAAASVSRDADSAEHSRWWPVQAMPKAIVRLEQSASSQLAHEMLAQSVAGLAAKAVNEGRGDEMVWIGSGNRNVEDLFAPLFKRHLDLELRGTFDVWELIDRYAKKGIIKGYIVFRSDESAGDINQHRAGTDYSVNVATSLAGLLDGVIVDEKLEGEARSRGLTRLMDVRGKTQLWCFDRYRDQFNRRMVCTQDPRKPHVRDLAIAQKALTVYGHDAPTPAVMEWLEPLSPILGWNGGDEFTTTQLSTRYGHIQTCTDWCMNLPVLMAGTETMEPQKAPDFDPRTIDWNDRRSTITFISSDGDNVQWLQGNFLGKGQGIYYWSNPQRGTIPFGWSCCFSQLAQLCPETMNIALATQSPNDSFIEWGGGYYYPDLFGDGRKDRWELLARQARRTWGLMKNCNTRIIGFNVAEYDSPDARKAYEVFASQTEGLLGIVVFQYSRYEEGGGETFWVKDRNGIELPVITARYSLWEHQNDRERAGTPAKVAREIAQTVAVTRPDELPRHDWVICHVWSYFKKATGADENAENIAQANAVAEGAVRGYSPVVWCADRLPETIRVVRPEEMIWRVRMEHDSAQTKAFMSRFK